VYGAELQCRVGSRVTVQCREQSYSAVYGAELQCSVGSSSEVMSC
jgi:hypothetical protein